jgi:hypothetical protein
LTFHRALQFSPSHHAFAVFGFTFAIMLLLTCTVWFGERDGNTLASIAIAHLLAQSVFTVGVHVREIRLSPAMTDRLLRWAAVLGPLFAAPLVYVAREMTGQMMVGEDIYLRFLVFYGLVFPAFVLIVMMSRSSLRASMIIYMTLVVVCLPLYEFGFIAGRTWLLAIALAILLIAAITMRLRMRTRMQTHTLL